MLDFYRDERVDESLIESSDGDMLLFQWGTYDWGDGKHFQIDITRQFLLKRKDEPYQLHLKGKFPPDAENAQFGAGDQWCESPEYVAAFDDFIRQTPVFVLYKNKIASEVEIRYEQC